MMHSMILLLSSAVGATMASSSSDTASSVVNAQEQQQQWYPDFSSGYESGTCITSPASAIRAMMGIPGMDFNEDATVEYAEGDDAAEVEMEIMASATKEWCCAIWFPDQEGCGCLGDCQNSQDRDEINNREAEADEWEEEYVRWTQDIVVAIPSEEFYYPEFDNADYEDGKCVKAVHFSDHQDTDDDNFATKEGRPLHSSWLQPSLAECCENWFGEQESESCLNSNKGNVVDGQLATSINVTMTANKAVVC